MKRLLFLAVGLFAASVVVAVAAAQTTGSDVAKLKLTADGQQHAMVNVHERFTSVESATFVFEFSSENPLDPGESIRVTPETWLRDPTPPYSRGPGFTNITASPQYSRTMTVVQYAGFPPDPLLAELLDGKEHLILNTDDGPVTVTSLTVSVTGEQ